MKDIFEGVKRLGFGCMRPPMKGTEIDYDKFSEMIDLYLENGYNYFDTAHGYVDGRSEDSLKRCLTSRHPRESFLLTTKLSDSYFKCEEDIIPFFESQLKECGVTYFDFYLMHAQNKNNYDQYVNCKAYEICSQLKKDGKIRYIGFSFHDDAEFLDKILTEQKDIDVVQLQFNYADYERDNIQSRKCYEVCVKHNKPVIVMEPVKGGALSDLPKNALKVLEDLNGGSAASYAIRFVAGFENVKIILSGMSNLDMVKDNIYQLENYKPLNDKEKAAIKEVCDIFDRTELIQCTNCRYCVKGCPKSILIPDLIAARNIRVKWENWTAIPKYKEAVKENGKPSDCIGCGKCEITCPQHLPIIESLKEIADEFERLV